MLRRPASAYLGRPDQVSLVFDRKVRLAGPRPTPGTDRTKVITDGVDLHWLLPLQSPLL